MFFQFPSPAGRSGDRPVGWPVGQAADRTVGRPVGRTTVPPSLLADQLQLAEQLADYVADCLPDQVALVSGMTVSAKVRIRWIGSKTQ